MLNCCSSIALQPLDVISLLIPHIFACVDFVCYFECYSFLNHTTGKDWILLNIAYNFCAIGKI
jgi:hypothetical protein